MEIVKQSAPMFSVLADGIRDYAFFLLDPKGFITSWNTGAEQIEGYTEEEILGKPFSCFYSQDKIELNEPARHLGQAASSGSLGFQGWQKRKDGSLFWASVLLSALHDKGNNLTGFLVITQDFTEHKRIEAQAAIVELSHDAIFTTDSDGTVRSWNRGAQALYGYSATEMIGRSIQIVFAPAQPMPVLHNLVESINVEETHLTKAGTFLTTSVTVSPMKDPAGNVVTVSWICRDTSISRRLLEELERSNKDLQQFAYVASHDLQEPVRAVIGCLQLLEGSLGAALNERSTQFLSEASNGATRMQALINDLLSYAQVHTKAADLVATDLSTVLSEVIQNLQASINSVNAKVFCEQLPVIEVDRSQMRRVFQNLIENAIKYRSAATPEISVSATKRSGEWVFCIADNGIGLDMQFAERIFDIFQRLHPRSKYQGTGIGLSICKRIVERHGGRVWVDSEPGSGSKFFFSLPTRMNGDAL